MLCNGYVIGCHALVIERNKTIFEVVNFFSMLY